jgi:hypothetical protein
VRGDLRTQNDTQERRPDHRTGRPLDFFFGAAMAKLIIKDLVESVELDREAMAAIVGGARVGARSSMAAPLVPASARVVDYPPGFPGAHQTIIHSHFPEPAALRGARR